MALDGILFYKLTNELKKLNTGEAILTSINLLKDLYISVEKCNRVHHNETPSLLRTSF